MATRRTSITAINDTDKALYTMIPKKIPDHPSTREDDRGALLMPPSPPEPGTIRLLIAAGCTWTSREVPGATQLDITLVSPSARRVKRGPR